MYWHKMLRTVGSARNADRKWREGLFKNKILGWVPLKIHGSSWYSSRVVDAYTSSPKDERCFELGTPDDRLFLMMTKKSSDRWWSHLDCTPRLERNEIFISLRQHDQPFSNERCFRVDATTTQTFRRQTLTAHHLLPIAVLIEWVDCVLSHKRSTQAIS